MAKKKKAEESEILAPVAEMPATEFADDRYTTYGEYVLTDRAIPDARDGLKPVQRRILWAMYCMGLHPTKLHKKCAAIVGEVMARYHPHGDASIYDALVNLNNPEPMVVVKGSSGHPFGPIDPQGNFGAPPRKETPAAAMRYTEARLSLIGLTHFECAEVAQTRASYDGNNQEPVVIPTRLPMLLLMGSSGVAVGASTDIPRYGLGAVLAAARLFVRKAGKIGIKSMVKALGGPDYGHSTLISTMEDVMEMYSEGKGTLRYECTHHVVHGKERHELMVTSLAPGFNLEKFKRLLGDLQDEGKILAANDMSSDKGFHYSVLFKDPAVVEERIIPALRSFVSYQWNMIDTDTEEGEEPRFLRSVKITEYFHMWLESRRKCELDMLLLEKKRALEAKAREEAKLAASQNAVVIAQILSNRKMPHEAKIAAIQKQIKLTWAGKTRTLTVEQVEFLLDQKIRSMSHMDADRCTEAIKTLLATLARIAKDREDIDGVIDAHLARYEKTFAKSIAAWTHMEHCPGGKPLSLPEASKANNGYWLINAAGFVRNLSTLPTTRAAMAEGIVAPVAETLTVVEADGTANLAKSVFLAHGRSDYSDVVGLATSNNPYLVVVDGTGCAALIENPPKASEVQAIKLAEGVQVIAAFGCADGDTLHVFTSAGHGSVVIGKDLTAKRPNCLGKLVVSPGKGKSRKAPVAFLVPKGGALVANSQGRISPEEVKFSNVNNVFAVGASNFVILGNGTKYAADAKKAASLAKSDGLVRAYVI